MFDKVNPGDVVVATHESGSRLVLTAVEHDGVVMGEVAGRIFGFHSLQAEGWTVSVRHALIKGRDYWPAPPWQGHCDNCDDATGYGPAGTVGFTEKEIDDWFYEHTIEKEDADV